MDVMETKYLVAIDDFCARHEIEISFVDTLQKSGLIELTTRDNSLFIQQEQLPLLEKIICFYYDLDINIEGIEAISHLLEQIDEMKEEIHNLKNRLRFYEEFNG
jgi:hypothetical protein